MHKWAWDKFRATDPTQAEERERLHWFVRHLVAFETHLATYIQNGEAAKAQLSHIIDGELDHIKPYHI